MSFETSIEWNNLLMEMEQGSMRALSRLITNVENKKDGWFDVMSHLVRNTGKASIIGITGTPGAGKSSLIERITHEFVKCDKKVAVIAVDPSSPFSGGAILGDRLRMQNVCNLDEVFVRSMATRGALGGVNDSIRDVVNIMDAFGKDIIVIETIGVGQDEVEIVKIADIVIVVCVPGQGDIIQAMKSGLMEIADIFVVNKADKEGAEEVVSDIESMLHFSNNTNPLKKQIVKTSANTGNGVTDLISLLFQQIQLQAKPNSQHQKNRIENEILFFLERELRSIIRLHLKENETIDGIMKQILSGKTNSYSLVKEITSQVTESISNSMANLTRESVHKGE